MKETNFRDVAHLVYNEEENLLYITYTMRELFPNDAKSLINFITDEFIPDVRPIFLLADVSKLPRMSLKTMRILANYKKEHLGAAAIVGMNFTAQTLSFFYVNTFKPKPPHRVFGTMEEAKKWLKLRQEEYFSKIGNK